MLLGKPGAGKSTFLKYLLFQALDGKAERQRIPIFVNLKDLSDSKCDLMDYIVEQFDICRFPDAAGFVTRILEKGNCILLLDGLDEVRSTKESSITKQISDFSDKFKNNQFVISCRVAAYDYCFEKFTNIELADFNEEQIKSFISNWFPSDNKTANLCLHKLNESQEIKELASTPLLLILLCLTFEQTLDFPDNRAELYKEGVDTLLKKWDSSRRINREDAYKYLSLRRKETMLSEIAAKTFEQGEYFLPQRTLEAYIKDFIGNLPKAQESTLEPDSEAILISIEAQHGILVQRAKGIYSFSHLTFQEYFTAQYIVDNAQEGTLDSLISYHLHDRQWREIILLTAGMLPKADSFICLMKKELDELKKDKGVKYILSLMSKLARKPSPYPHNITLCLSLLLLVYCSEVKNKQELLSKTISVARLFGKVQGEKHLAESLSLGHGFGLGKKFFRAILHKNAPSVASDFKELGGETLKLDKYLKSIELLLECLNAEAYITKSFRIELLSNLLLPE